MKDDVPRPVGKWSYGRHACGEYEIDGQNISLFKARFGKRALFGEGTICDGVIVLRLTGEALPKEEICAAQDGTERPAEVVYSPDPQGGGYCASGSGDLAGEVPIADMYRGKKVMALADRAFERCTGVTEIVLPEGLVRLGERAFFGCRSLKKIALPAGLGYIPSHAFFGCSALEEIAVPEGVAEIGNHAFEFCKSLRRVRLPASLKRVGHGAFWGCESLEEVHADDLAAWCGVRFDGPDANPLSCGAALTAGGERTGMLTLPEGVPEIEAYAFAGSMIEAIALPKSVKKIGAFAFHGCTALSRIVYGGTAAAWLSVEKGTRWEDADGPTVVCSDGTIEKNGTVQKNKG